MKSTQAKTVGIWLRVSTEDQVKGESPETHERRARLYAEAKDWNIVTVYRLDAVSGKTVKDHPEAKRMLEDVRAGRINGLIFSKLARLARNTKELLDFADIFREQGADLISLAESIDTSTPAGRLFFTIIAAMCQWEREEIAQRVALSVPIRAQLGKPLGGQAPFGYQWKDKQFVVDEAEAPVRKLLYELFREYKRKKTVARLLNERGHRTRNGAPFSDTTVDRLIRDPSAKGLRRANYTQSKDSKRAWKVKPEAEWIHHEVEAIVSEELWAECNAILDTQREKGKRQTKRVVHLFTGFVFCTCDQKMYVPSNTPKYVCTECRNKIPIEDLERIYHGEIKNFLLSPERLAEHLEQANETIREKAELLAHLEGERAKVQGETDKLYALYQCNAIDPKGFGERYKPLAERLQQLDNTIPATQAEVDVLKIAQLSQAEILSEARDLYSAWPTLPLEDKRQIVETITERITVAKDEVTIDLIYSGDSFDLPSDDGGDTPPPAPSSPDGGGKATSPQGFIAATSWKRAGKSICCAAREIVMLPLSSGSRSTSSTRRSNSGNSSRNSTPRCASVISPGRGLLPPPTSAAPEAVWCGLRKLRTPHLRASKPEGPIEATAAASSASASVIGGSRPGRRCASMDLPEPGGPSMRIEWAPAAAISSARLACGWPRTSPRSGAASGGTGLRVTRCGASSPSCSAAHSAPRWCETRISAEEARLASARLAVGSSRRCPAATAFSAADKAPCTGRISPDNDSSPRISSFSRRSGGTCAEAARMPRAIARSKRPPSLGRSAGARLQVMRRLGNW